MKTIYKLFAISLLLVSFSTFGQDTETTEEEQTKESDDSGYERVEARRHWNNRQNRRSSDGHEIKTIFRNNGSSGGYAAFSNKFTTINGDYANMVEFYGGWYLNHQFLIGIGGAATTNYIPVLPEHSVNPHRRMSYEFVQAGLMTEYVIASDRAVHVAFQLFAGAGATLQYERSDWDDDHWEDINYYEHDEDFFYVVEPGVKVEVNVFRWLRFCPGVSYRMALESESKGLSDDALSGASINMTLKIGKF